MQYESDSGFKVAVLPISQFHLAELTYKARA